MMIRTHGTLKLVIYTGKEIACSLNVVNDTVKRAVKLMEDFHGSLTKDDKKFELLLQCIQEHR